MFDCALCEFSNNSFTTYLKHARLQHESAPLFRVACPDRSCHQSFTLVRSLSRHIKRKHHPFFVEHLTKSNASEPSHASEPSLPLPTPDSFDGSDVVDMDTGSVDGADDGHVSEADMQQEGGTDVVRSVAIALLTSRETFKLPAHITSIIANETQNMIIRGQVETTKKVVDILKGHSVSDEIINIVKAASQEETEVSAACRKLDTAGKLERYVAKNMDFIAPKEKRLGLSPSGKKDTLQIIPIEASLRALLSYEDVLEDVLTGHQSESGVLRDVVDGLAYQEHPVFSEEPTALCIIFYMDEFTVTNPLRGRSKNHKIMAGYFSLANIRPERRSQLKGIQLALLCLSKHIKKYGLDEWMKDVTKELKRLAVEGLDIITDTGKNYHFSVQLFIAVGDNLGAHQMGGFMEGFTATRSCRFCMVSLADLRLGDMGTLRTITGHNDQVSIVLLDPTMAPTYGVKKRSVFDGVGQFSPIGSLPSDVAHDIFEGVLVTIVTLVLQRCIKERYFDQDKLNQRLEGFTYVGSDKADKPCRLGGVGLKVSVKQTFSQAWCLLRLLPLMVGDLVPANDPAWQVLLQFLRIVEFICAPEMRRGHVPILKDLIQELITARQETFPDEHMKPKDHFLLHYPEQFLRFGPLVNVWTFRFEAKHNYFLEVFKPSKNHVNVCATLAKRHQYLQCMYRSEAVLFNTEKSLTFAKKIQLKHLPPALLPLLAAAEDIDDLETVILAKSITVGSIKYGVKMVVVTGLDGDLYNFRAIQQVLVTATKQYLVCHTVHTVDFDFHFNAYVIHIENNLELVEIEGLRQKGPLGIYCMPGGHQNVVVLKHKLLFAD